uniref:Sodium-coupled neutral amino acid symporter 2 n=1 Tax=Pygocentrus nattereri TaxID=42514 RepID=A0AAR2JX51_PYGNA
MRTLSPWSVSHLGCHRREDGADSTSIYACIVVTQDIHSEKWSQGTKAPTPGQHVEFSLDLSSELWELHSVQDSGKTSGSCTAPREIFKNISLLCMVFFLIVVIYKMFQIPCPLPLDVINMTVNSTVAQMNSTVCMPKYFFFNSQTVYAVPILTFAFVCHPAILPMYEELRDRSRMKMQNVANVSFFAMFVMYLLAALFGYLTFNNAVESELLHTYSKVYRFDVVLLIVRLAVLTAVTLSVPVVLFPIRTSVNHLLCASRVQLSGVNVFVIFESMMSVQKIGAAVFLASGFIVMFGIDTVLDWPQPTSVKELQRFL